MITISAGKLAFFLKTNVLIQLLLKFLNEKNRQIFTSSPPAIGEAGALDHEIESRQGIEWQLFKRKEKN
jgi:hypothetical protein